MTAHLHSREGLLSCTRPDGMLSADACAQSKQPRCGIAQGIAAPPWTVCQPKHQTAVTDGE